MLAIIFFNFGYAEMNVSDVWNPDGSAKIIGKDINDEQKTIIYEWERENAEYILKNIGKKSSELKDIPAYTKLMGMHSFDIPPKKFVPDEICFSSDCLSDIYKTLGEYDKWFEEERRHYENGVDLVAPYSQYNWLYVLLTSGHYREAERFFPEFVSIAYPWLTKETVLERLKKRERVPEILSKTIIAKPWDDILSIKDKPEDLTELYKTEEKIEFPKRMHRYFHSKDAVKRAAALDFYHEKKTKFMIEKASKTWKGEIKRKAEKYLEELQKSTTVQ
jgi:hypothetical protein